MRLLSIAAACLIGMAIAPAFAQAPTQPFYGITTSGGAKGFQPVDSSHGLPVAARAVATCGAQSLTAGVMYPVTLDLTGTLCIATGGGGITAAVTVANGADVAEGNTTDAASTAGGTGTLSAKQRLMTTQLATINTTLGSPFQAGGSIGNTSFAVTQGTSPWVMSGTSTVSGTVSATQGTSPWVVSNGGTFAVQASQATAANLNATVVGTGTFATQATLAAGSAIIGNVRIDQTTPGTTNGVVIAPSSSATVGITPVVSTSGESSHVLKASAGNTYAAYATNLTSTQGFLLLINATSAPADGAVTPLACAPLAPNGIASVSYAPGPPGVFGTGITAVVTSASTCFTKTTGVITAFISGSVQ